MLIIGQRNTRTVECLTKMIFNQREIAFVLSVARIVYSSFKSPRTNKSEKKKRKRQRNIAR